MFTYIDLSVTFVRALDKIYMEHKLSWTQVPVIRWCERALQKEYKKEKEIRIQKTNVGGIQGEVGDGQR